MSSSWFSKSLKPTEGKGLLGKYQRIGEAAGNSVPWNKHGWRPTVCQHSDPMGRSSTVRKEGPPGREEESSLTRVWWTEGREGQELGDVEGGKDIK